MIQILQKLDDMRKASRQEAINQKGFKEHVFVHDKDNNK